MSYNIDSIETLSFRDGVRKRIQMYLGSNDMQGVYQGLQEIISNSIDEFLAGYGKEIKINLYGKKRISVEDNGRGVPFGIKKDGTNTLEAIYSTPHTGGKFSDKSYQFSAGLNGIGAKATCLSSEKFEVTSTRDKKQATISFSKGNLVSYSEKEIDSLKSGTVVTYIPDAEVYSLEPICFDFETICSTCKNLSYLTKGLKFILNYYSENEDQVTETKEYFSENGLGDLIKNAVKNPVIEKPICHSIKSENGTEVEIALQWSRGSRERSFCFTNGVENSEGGTPITGVKRSITNNFKKSFHTSMDGDMARTGLIYAVGCKIENPSFANQTKTKVNNPELNSLAYKCFTEAFESFKNLHPKDFKNLEDYLVKEKKAEEAAQRARNKVLETVRDVERNQKKKVFASDKLKDAEFLGQDSILLIVEGDSAIGAMSQARDVEKYGLLALRGKVINCLSNPEEKIFENEEIKLILSAMNIIPGKYNSKKLRYGKIAICTDADSDGFHIGLLIMSALQFLAPEFIQEGRLCWLHAPLYIETSGKKENYYFTDEELDAAKREGKVKGLITRNKGLGEMDSDSAHKSMFTEEYQRMDVMEYSEEAIDLLLSLMGEEVAPRRDFIFSHVDFSKITE